MKDYYRSLQTPRQKARGSNPILSSTTRARHTKDPCPPCPALAGSLANKTRGWLEIKTSPFAFMLTRTCPSVSSQWQTFTKLLEAEAGFRSCSRHENLRNYTYSVIHWFVMIFVVALSVSSRSHRNCRSAHQPSKNKIFLIRAYNVPL